MPPAASFIALQCFQCFTMQVKQQKKSSNKWTCVVCNEKQSVRKVYAQGPMAKDVRKFVQAFNMSRKFIDDEEENLSAVVCDGENAGGSSPGNEKKRRTDWSEYLDPEENEDTGTDLDTEIVTEMQKEMFKKPRLKQNLDKSTRLQSRYEDGKGLFKPLLPKRDTTNQAKQKRASKWSEYLTEGKQDEEEAMATAMDNGTAAITPSQMVQEEIHPDFM